MNKCSHITLQDRLAWIFYKDLTIAMLHFQINTDRLTHMVTTQDLKEKIIAGLNLEDIEADEIGDADPLFGEDGLGLDSVDAIELTLVVEKEYGVKVTNIADAESIFATATSLADFINKQQQS